MTSGHWLTGWARANAAQTPFDRLFERHGDHPDLQRFVERLAQTIAIEMNVIDPQRLILGGGVIAMRGFRWRGWSKRSAVICAGRSRHRDWRSPSAA